MHRLSEWAVRGTPANRVNRKDGGGGSAMLEVEDRVRSRARATLAPYIGATAMHTMRPCSSSLATMAGSDIRIFAPAFGNRDGFLPKRGGIRSGRCLLGYLHRGPHPSLLEKGDLGGHRGRDWSMPCIDVNMTVRRYMVWLLAGLFSEGKKKRERPDLINFCRRRQQKI